MQLTPYKTALVKLINKLSIMILQRDSQLLAMRL